MAKFISIPTVVTGTPALQFNTDVLSHVSYVSATSVVIYSGPRTITLTIAGATTTNFYNAVLAAIVSPVGPVVTNVNMPTGVTVTVVAVT